MEASFSIIISIQPCLAALVVSVGGAAGGPEADLDRQN